MTDLHVVIVNYDTRDLLRDCLTSVRESRLGGRSLAVTVVDNGSHDGSADMVEAEFAAVSVVRSDNLGYPHGNNLGLKRLDARYHLLLNPDTLLPPGALALALAHMDEVPEIGALGPRLVLADGSLDPACRRGFPTVLNSMAKFSGLARLFPRSHLLASYNLTYLNEDESADVDSVVGAFMLLRGQALAEIGGLDEAYFMYAEDVDLCYRLKSLGWRVEYWPEITVLHYKRAASSKSERAPREFYTSMRLFYDKYHAGAAAPGERPLVRLGITATERLVGYGRGA
ncbi:MAG: glycosyltransferase family 2 protein [Anaerolineae bacterium]